MDIVKETSEDQTARLTIKSSLCVAEATVLREELLACLSQYQGLVLNLNQVADCDTAGVQCLYLAGRTARKAGKHFSITAISAAVEDVLMRMGTNLQEIMTNHEEDSDA